MTIADVNLSYRNVSEHNATVNLICFDNNKPISSTKYFLTATKIDYIVKQIKALIPKTTEDLYVVVGELGVDIVINRILTDEGYNVITHKHKRFDW